MPPDDRPNPIDERTAQRIRRKAWRIVVGAGLPAQEREDVERELIARLLPRLEAYDSSRGELQGFAFTLLERLAANLARDLCAAKRDRRRSRPLPRENAGPADEKHGAEQTNLALDLAEVLRSLPPDLRELAERLGTQSIAEIARDMNVPYSTLRYRVVHTLRKAFEKGGLRKYLDDSSSSCGSAG